MGSRSKGKKTLTILLLLASFSFIGSPVAAQIKKRAAKLGIEKWLGRDDAAACNEIATIINSITKESKEVEQYCSLTGTAPQN